MNNISKSLSSGAFISLGVFTYLITLQKTSNIFLASIVFYLGLGLVFSFKASLFTGQVLTKAHLPLQEYLITLTSTWVFNFLGAIITTVLLNQILHPDITQLMTNKLALNPIQILISSCFCNILVCSAVANYKGTKNHLMSGFYIMCFIILGLEHSVANMSYITLGLLQGIKMNIASIIILLSCSSVGNMIGGRVVVEIIKQNRKEEKTNGKKN